MNDLFQEDLTDAWLTHPMDERDRNGRADGLAARGVRTHAAANRALRPTAYSAAAAGHEDRAVRAKLVEFRTHLKEFERAAGSHATGAMAPSGTPNQPGITPASPTTEMAPADRAKAAAAVDHSEADKHLDAISAILSSSKT